MVPQVITVKNSLWPYVRHTNQYMDRMLKGSLKLIKDAKKRNKVVVEENNQQEEEVLEKKEDEEGVEPEKEEENLVSEDIAMDLNEPGSEEEERLLHKKVD